MKNPLQYNRQQSHNIPHKPLDLLQCKQGDDEDPLHCVNLSLPLLNDIRGAIYWFTCLTSCDELGQGQRGIRALQTVRTYRIIWCSAMDCIMGSSRYGTDGQNRISDGLTSRRNIAWMLIIRDLSSANLRSTLAA